jgi:hypothetical protein
MKYATIRDILTDEETVRAYGWYKEMETGFAQRLCKEIIQPNLERINRKLGQQNEPMYLAYLIEYAFMMGKRECGAA